MRIRLADVEPSPDVFAWAAGVAPETFVDRLSVRLVGVLPLIGLL